MKSIFLNAQLLIYSPLFFLLLNISDGKLPVPDLKDRIAVARSVTPDKKVCQDCRTLLTQWNDELKYEADMLIDANEVGVYWDCLLKLIPALNYETNLYDYYFLLDCLTNLMDYYDMVDHNEEILNEIEDAIYNISNETGEGDY